MSVTVTRRVIELGDKGLRGRDGISGDCIALTQTNTDPDTIIAEPDNPGAAYAADDLFLLTIAYQSSADSAALEVTGINTGDPRLLKIAGTTTNFDPKTVAPGDTMAVRFISTGVRAGSWDVMLPALAPATGAQTLESLKPDVGSAALAVTPAGLGVVLESMGVMLNRLALMRPTRSAPFAVMFLSDNRFWASTYVLDGPRGDYAIHEFVNEGHLQSPLVTDCWRYNGCVAVMDGIQEDLAIHTGEDIGAGIMDTAQPPIWEPVYRFGPYGVTYNAADWDYAGPRHGHLKNSSCGIFLNGVTSTNYALAVNRSIGQVLRGTSFLIDQAWDVYLKNDTTLVGRHGISHALVTGGVQIFGNMAVSASNIGLTTMYGGMLCGRGDTVKGMGATAVAADREDGQDYGANGVLNANLGEFTLIQNYNAARPTHMLQMVLPGNGPVQINGGGYSWSGNGANRDSWIQDRGEGYPKVYTAGQNRANNAPLLCDGLTFNTNVIYQVRNGALV